ncbi:MAG: putative hydrolase, partial [Bacilli bacterium]|nr:putative hydrolase [Bacilli bacterium]
VIQRINNFKKQGGIFTLATGRTLASTLPFIRSLNLTTPVILYNGAKIYHPVDQCYLIEHLLPPASVVRTLDMYLSTGKSVGLDLLVFHQEQIYSSNLSEAVLRLASKDKVSVKKKPFEYFYKICQSINKMMLIGSEDKIRNFQQEIGMALNSVQSEPSYLEILPPKINKGTALLHFINMVGGHPDEFAAVGDNLNDLEMVGMLRHGIAVKNAHPRLREVCVWVTSHTHDQDALIDVFDYVEVHNEAIKFQ